MSKNRYRLQFVRKTNQIGRCPNHESRAKRGHRSVIRLIRAALSSGVKGWTHSTSKLNRSSALTSLSNRVCAKTELKLKFHDEIKKSSQSAAQTALGGH